MKISRVKIKNFRSIVDLEIPFGDTTVFIGSNGVGKSAILDAVRIALTRRWGQRGTGFTELDVHRPGETADPKTLPPVTIEIWIYEPSAGTWDPDMVAALDDIMTVDGDRNLIAFRVTCAWNPDKDSFDPVWEFLQSNGDPLTGKAQRATNLTGFFKYLPVFWLGPLRDAADEFTIGGHWGRLLQSVRIPDELEKEVLAALAEIDAKVIGADARLTDIANLIGKSTRIAIGEGPGGARLNMLPVAIEEMLKRAGVLIRHESFRPWLPLDHQGQGLQSLAVIFLFQAAVLQQLAEAEQPGTEAVFAVEEPEVHLHPQAARSLWEKMSTLTGQRIMTTHSPYFVQHIPLRDLRLVRLKEGRTTFAYIPLRMSSTIPWTENVDKFVTGAQVSSVFEKHPTTGCVTAKSWFSSTLEDTLARCFKDDADAATKRTLVEELRHSSRLLPSVRDETELGFHGRRIRGEIFFARRWLLVEGVCEYLLCHALGKVMGWPLDAHGVAVIDFQNSGSAGIYSALAEAFQIPWNMIVDGDAGGENCLKQIAERGFSEDEVNTRIITLPKPHDLEACLLAEGHEDLLRKILDERGEIGVLTCSVAELQSRLRNRKTDYMSALSAKIGADLVLAGKMPKAFVDYIAKLKGGVL